MDCKKCNCPLTIANEYRFCPDCDSLETDLKKLTVPKAERRKKRDITEPLLGVDASSLAAGLGMSRNPQAYTPWRGMIAKRSELDWLKCGPDFTLAWFLEERERLSEERRSNGRPAGRPSEGRIGSLSTTRLALESIASLAGFTLQELLIGKGVARQVRAIAVALLVFMGFTQSALAEAMECDKAQIVRRRKLGLANLQSRLGAEHWGQSASGRVSSTPSRLSPYQARDYAQHHGEVRLSDDLSILVPTPSAYADNRPAGTPGWWVTYTRPTHWFGPDHLSTTPTTKETHVPRFSQEPSVVGIHRLQLGPDRRAAVKPVDSSPRGYGRR